MRLLCVAWAAPPLNVSAALRERRLLLGLQQLGVEVDLLAPDWAAAGGPQVDAALDVRDRVRVIGTPSLDPHFLRARRGSGQAGSGGAGRGGARAWVRLNALPDPMAGWLPAALGALSRLGAERPYDWILAAAPPYSGFLAGLAAHVVLGAPLALDYHDLWSSSPLPRSTAWRRVSARLERATLRVASAAIAVTPELLARVRADAGSLPARCGVVPLGCDGSLELPPPPHEPFRLTYAGSVYEGRPLLPVLDSLAAADGAGLTLRLVGAPPPGRYASAPPRWLEPAPYADQAELARHYADSSALLLLLNPAYDEEHTGKLFDYLRTGRPVLAVGNPRAAAVRLLGALGYPHVAVEAEAAAIVAGFRDIRAAAPLSRAEIAALGLDRRFGPEALARALLSVIGAP